MADKFLLNDPDHWRARAEEARILANEMNDSKTKDAMLRIADEYEHLARWVKDWAMRRLAKNSDTQHIGGTTWTSIHCC